MRKWRTTALLFACLALLFHSTFAQLTASFINRSALNLAESEDAPQLLATTYDPGQDLAVEPVSAVAYLEGEVGASALQSERDIALYTNLGAVLRSPSEEVPLAYRAEISEMGLLVYEQRVKISNRYDATATNIELRIMLIPEEVSGYQLIYEEQISPHFDDIEIDERGNRFAIIRSPSLRAGETMQVAITYNLANTNWFVDKEQLPQYSQKTADPYILSFLAPEPYIESTHPDIMFYAKTIVGDETNPYRKAELLFNWVNTAVDYDENEELYAHKGALSALYNRKGVCTEYAALLVALLRAEGVPARMAWGYLLTDATKLSTDQAVFANTLAHTWVEFYLEGFGWVPCEPTYILLDEDGLTRLPAVQQFAALPSWGHILLGYDVIDNFRSDIRFQVSYQGSYNNMLASETPAYLQVGQKLMDDEIKIFISDWNTRIGFADQEPLLSGNGVTMVPMRRIYELFGAAVGWNEEEGRISAARSNQVVELQIGQASIWVNGLESELLEAPYIDPRTERTLIPLRAVSEGLGAVVEWDAYWRRILILPSDS